MCTQREAYYNVLAHVIVKAGKSKSAVWAGRLETQENQWCSTSQRQYAGEVFFYWGKPVLRLIRRGPSMLWRVTCFSLIPKHPHRNPQNRVQPNICPPHRLVVDAQNDPHTGEFLGLLKKFLAKVQSSGRTTGNWDGVD